MADRLRELLDLPSTVLLDIDDGGRLLVGNDASGTTQLAEIGADGTWRWLTDLGEPCTGRYVPGERAVVVSADDGGTERAQLHLLRLVEASAPEDGVPDLQPLVQDPRWIHTLLDVVPGRVLYSTNRRNGVDFDVVLRELATGEEQVVWDAGGWFEAAALSPDGRWAALSRMTLLPASSELLLVEVGAGESAPITDRAEPGQWSNPRWSDPVTLLASSDAGGQFASLRRFDVHARTLVRARRRPAPRRAGLAVAGRHPAGARDQ